MYLLFRIAALLFDKSPRAVAITKHLLEILDGKAVIPGGIAVLIRQLACDGDVSHEICDALFPGADAFVSTEGVVAVDIGRDWTVPEAITHLNTMVPPMEPVMPDEGIKHAAENPGAQRNNPLAIIGQQCRNSVGRACVIVLDTDERGRSAYLFRVQDRLVRRCLVLAKPKAVAPGI